MSNLETKLSYVANHVLSIDEFNFEVRDLQVIISPKLKNERTEEDLVYFLQDAIYRKANEINNYYVGEGTRSLQLDFNGKDAIYVNFTTIPKIKKTLNSKDNMSKFNELYESAIGEIDLKPLNKSRLNVETLSDFTTKEVKEFIKKNFSNQDEVSEYVMKDIKQMEDNNEQLKEKEDLIKVAKIMKDYYLYDGELSQIASQIKSELDYNAKLANKMWESGMKGDI